MKPNITLELTEDMAELLYLALADYANVLTERVATGDYTHGLGQADLVRWAARYVDSRRQVL